MGGKEIIEVTDMTTIERKRAGKLEKLVSTCDFTSFNVSRMLILGVILTMAVNIPLFFALLEDDEIYVVLIMHIFFTGMFTSLFVFMGANRVGDQSFIGDLGNKTFGGSYYMWEQLAVMPFEGKDLMNLRLIWCEKQMIAAGGSTAVIMLMIFIAGRLGYNDYSGLIGLLTLFILLNEIILIVLNLLVKKWAVGLALNIAVSIAPIFIALFGCSDETGESSPELASAFSGRLSGLSFMSGISGIIILAVFLIVIAKVSEHLVSRVKNRAWSSK